MPQKNDKNELMPYADAFQLLKKMNEYCDREVAKGINKQNHPRAKTHLMKDKDGQHELATQFVFKSNRAECYYVIQALIKCAVGGNTAFVYKSRNNMREYIIGLNLQQVEFPDEVQIEVGDINKIVPYEYTI